eukprot:1161162-Pelagomonas_calceolata.AAC.7
MSPFPYLMQGVLLLPMQFCALQCMLDGSDNPSGNDKRIAFTKQVRPMPASASLICVLPAAFQAVISQCDTQFLSACCVLPAAMRTVTSQCNMNDLRIEWSTCSALPAAIYATVVSQYNTDSRWSNEANVDAVDAQLEMEQQKDVDAGGIFSIGAAIPA